MWCAIMFRSACTFRGTIPRRKAPRVRASAVSLPLLVTLLPAPACAQLLDRYYPANVPAYQDWFAALGTPQSEQEAALNGIRVGDFIILPTISEAAGYDSNVTGLANGRGSAELDSSAALAANSDWSRNALNAALTVGDTRYWEDPRQSYTTWTASAGGAVDVGDDRIDLGYAHLNSVSLPTDVGTFGLGVPITDRVDDFRISDRIGPGPLILQPALDGQIYRFSPASNAPASVIGPLYDRDALTGSITAGYEFSGGHNLIAIVSDSHVAFQNSGQPQYPANYDDLSILGGIEYRQSALVAYRALIGWERRYPEGSGIRAGALSGPSAELDVLYSPDRLTTVTGRITHSLQDEPTGIIQGLALTSAELVLQRAVRRTVTVSASVRYDRANFPSGGPVQAAFSANAGATWQMTRNLSLSAKFNYLQSSDSGNALFGFSREQVLLQASVQL